MTASAPRKRNSLATGTTRTRGVKQARIEARADVADKALIEEAATLKGLTMSDYILSTLTERAKKDIAEERTWILSREESIRFVEAMQNPAPPTQALLDDFALYFAKRAK